MKISSNNEIQAFVHCSKCLEEVPSGVSPQQYASLEIGFTVPGLQVWCKRHNLNVMHIDFQGQRHPANTNATFEDTVVAPIRVQ